MPESNNQGTEIKTISTEDELETLIKDLGKQKEFALSMDARDD